MKDLLEIYKDAKMKTGVEQIKSLKKGLLENIKSDEKETEYDMDKFLYYKMTVECHYKKDYSVIGLTLVANLFALASFVISTFSLLQSFNTGKVQNRIEIVTLMIPVAIIYFGVFFLIGIVLYKRWKYVRKEKIGKKFSIILDEIDKEIRLDKKDGMKDKKIGGTSHENK